MTESQVRGETSGPTNDQTIMKYCVYVKLVFSEKSEYVCVCVCVYLQGSFKMFVGMCDAESIFNFHHVIGHP